MPLTVRHLDTPTLGDRSYIAHDGSVAVIVDPQRDLDRVYALLEQEGVRPGLIVETHMHNDYVSGGLQLSREHGIPLLTSHEDPVAFDRTTVRDTEIVPVGTFAVQALHTPGHTFTHMSYALLDPDGHAQGVFTGGSLLHGSTGRPDLLGQEHAPTLAALQYGSAHRLVDLLEDRVPIHPTHGFGSFCAATATCSDRSTIADEKRTNPALLLPEAEFIAQTLAGLDVFPAYYRHMGPANLAGPGPIDLSPLTPVRPDEVARLAAQGAWVVDLRNRVAWAQGHVPQTISFGIEGSMATYLGWVYPYGDKLVLIGDSEAQVRDAQRELVRIGIERPDGAYIGTIPDLVETPSTTPMVTFHDVPDALDRGVVLLDVRRTHEFNAAHIDGALNIPLHEVTDRANEVPEEREVWVHCAGAYRAAAAIGLLERRGRTATLINEPFEACLSVPGLRVVSGHRDAGPVASDEHTLQVGSTTA